MNPTLKTSGFFLETDFYLFIFMGKGPEFTELKMLKPKDPTDKTIRHFKTSVVCYNK